MRKFLWVGVIGIGAFLLSSVALAVMFFWTDSEGGLHVTDQVSNVPGQYRAVIRFNTQSFVNAQGLGFEVDGAGNFHFFDHSSPARVTARRPAPPPPTLPTSGPVGAPGDAVTPEQLAALQQRYQLWGGEPVPEVTNAKVKVIVSPDTFLLDNGQRATYLGIEFPSELANNAKFNQEVIAYQKKLMVNRTVQILYGPQRQDAQGRLIALVYIGTDMFVNAELVMNGYARVHTIPPNLDYRALFLRLQDFAQSSRLGMWAIGGIAVETQATPAPR